MMAKKYQIKKGFEDREVHAKPYSDRAGGGFFKLSECSQRDLKYLCEVIGIEEVEIIESSDDAGKEGK